MNHSWDRMGRRPFLAGAAAMIGSWSVPEAFHNFASGKMPTKLPMMRPVQDDATGFELLQLPEGFRYVSFGWTKDLLHDGSPTPGAHDGMAVIDDVDGMLTLCRNHELGSGRSSPDQSVHAYDALAAGGCTNLQFDSKNGKWIKAWPSLAGTFKNCAGGPTPWKTWLSCEESVAENGTKQDNGKILELNQKHGYVFEVPAQGIAKPLPIKEMGRFVHEAVAVDPTTSIVYQTEDRTPSGFYRFVPKVPGRLIEGGKLEMLAVRGSPDLIRSADASANYQVEWVKIDDPDLAHSPGTDNGGGVYEQGRKQGGAAFARLEGCWWGNDVCYFVSTSGGRLGAGQIWQYDPKREVLKLVFESSGPEQIDSPDNITVSPRGGLVLCEDGNRSPQKLHSLSPSGVRLDLAWNNIKLNGERNGIQGDYRGMEWGGASFSPDGRWLFVNIQTPGITFAITGPWESMGL
jgi:uncharacterized protein